MKNEITDKLRDTVISILERFAFMFAEVPEGKMDEWRGEYFYSAITFDGPGKGSVSITAPAPLCKELAANVLGDLDSEGITAETAGDAVKELLNIICGEFVAELYGTKEVVNLSVPSLEITDRGKWCELSADDGVIKVMVDEQPMIVSILIDV